MKTLISTVMVLVALSAGGAFAAEEAEQEAPPRFLPGAQVEMRITLQAPKQWKLNHQMPLTFYFDPEYLEEAPFTVSEPSLTVKLDQYTPVLTVVIPVRLQEKLADGHLTIPLPVRFSICNEVTDSCAFAEEILTIPVDVTTAASGDDVNQALKSGSVELSHLLSIP